MLAGLSINIPSVEGVNIYQFGGEQTLHMTFGCVLFAEHPGLVLHKSCCIEFFRDAVLICTDCKFMLTWSLMGTSSQILIHIKPSTVSVLEKAGGPSRNCQSKKKKIWKSFSPLSIS